MAKLTSAHPSFLICLKTRKLPGDHDKKNSHEDPLTRVFCFSKLKVSLSGSLNEFI